MKIYAMKAQQLIAPRIRNLRRVQAASDLTIKASVKCVRVKNSSILIEQNALMRVLLDKYLRIRRILTQALARIALIIVWNA
jgi:hypothetical protein